jgi:hypothetical protein
MGLDRRGSFSLKSVRRLNSTNRGVLAPWVKGEQ